MWMHCGTPRGLKDSVVLSVNAQSHLRQYACGADPPFRDQVCEYARIYQRKRLDLEEIMVEWGV